MPHLLIDLAKLKKNSKIPYKHAKVGLMVSLKQAKKLITPDEPHAVYVLPEKKQATASFRLPWTFSTLTPIAMCSSSRRAKAFRLP